jgi:hypothetical protein
MLINLYLAALYQRERQPMHREPTDWQKRNLASFQRFQEKWDAFEGRHPWFHRYLDFVLISYFVGSIILAVTARTVPGRVWSILGAVFYVVVTSYLWKHRHPGK